MSPVGKQNIAVENLDFPGLRVFLRALHREGLPVGILEIERLQRVFAAGPHLADERAWYRLLAGLLVKNEAQQEIFDRIFPVWVDSWPTLPDSGDTQPPTEEPDEGATDRDESRRPQSGSTDPTPFDLDSDQGQTVEPPREKGRALADLLARLVPRLDGSLRHWWPVAVPTVAIALALLVGMRSESSTNPWPIWWLSLAVLGVVVWREYRARQNIHAPASKLPPASDGPGYLPYLPRSEDCGFLSPEEIREIVWNVDRYIAEDETHRLDMDTTVARTAAEGNLFTPCYQRAVYPREVWLWEDGLCDSPLPEQLCDELHNHLHRTGLPVRRGVFAGDPRLIRWADGEDFNPLVVEGFRQQAIVLILTDGQMLAEAFSSDWSHQALHQLLHGLAGWQQLAVVDVSEGDHGLGDLLKPYRIPMLHPWQIPGFMAVGEATNRRHTPLFEVSGDLRAWAAALSLSPREPDLKLALRLRERLGLRAESWQLEALMQSDQTLEEGLRFDPRKRQGWLRWLVNAERQPDGIDQDGTLAQALDFWLAELDEEERERADRETKGLLPWKDTPAARQLARERALLLLWRQPDEATDTLLKLWQDPEQRAVVSSALAGYAPRDPEFAERVGGFEGDPVILLPWSMAEHCRRTTANRLTKMGIGAGLPKVPKGRFPAAGRSWLAVGIVTGLGAMGAVRFGGVVGALGGGISVGLAIGLWAWCEREKLLYRGRRSEASFKHPLPMMEIPGGTFLMGSPKDDNQADSDEHPQHEVTISPFLMSKTTVTQTQYRKLMGNNTAWGLRWRGGRLPATNVNWFEAVKFCNRLSEQADLKPCYDIDGDKVTWDHNADGYRLPTEAEWEYACRAGTTTRWFWGDEETGIEDYAWYEDNSDNQAHPVAEKKPNAWGLHDMAGNVWEWCWDWFGDYPSNSQKNPTGPSDGTFRLLRGGAFPGGPRSLRSAYRSDLDGPEFRVEGIGFRVACSRRQP